MNSVLCKTWLICSFGFSYLYSAQVPQIEKVIYAPRLEVEACRRAFDLQAQGEVEHQGLFWTVGGLLGGACKKMIRQYPSFAKNSSVACLLAVAGAFAGNYVYSMVQKNKAKRVFAEQTAETFPEDFMQNLQAKLTSGEQVDIRTIEDDGGMEEVTESEIEQWAALANKNHCYVCHKDLETGQLLLVLPYYSPEAREAYRDREEMLGQSLNVPISYNPIQEMNPLYKKTKDIRATISLPFAHDIQQNLPEFCRTRMVGLTAILSESIKRGHIEDPLLQVNTVPV